MATAATSFAAAVSTRVSMSPNVPPSGGSSTAIHCYDRDLKDGETTTHLNFPSKDSTNAKDTISGSSGEDLTPTAHQKDKNIASIHGAVDSRFVLPPCELPPRKELEPVEIFVANAVKEQTQQQHHTNGMSITPNYRGILEAFRFKKDLPMIRTLLIALRTSGSTLSLLTSESSKHAQLIHQVVRFNPFSPDTVTTTTAAPKTSTVDCINDDDGSCDLSLADAQCRLILALVSANSVFVVPALTALWKLLTYQIKASHPDRARIIHATMATLFQLCPKAKSELVPIVASTAPFRMRPEAELSWYYKQCIAVLQYLPTIRPQVMELMVSRCLEMDVEIVITDVGHASIDTEDNSGDIFQLDLDEPENEKHTPDQSSSKDITVDDMADKLDSLMLLLLECMEQSLRDGIPYGDLYHTLSRVFECAIVVTHKSKFVQFLIPYLCGEQVSASAIEQHHSSTTMVITPTLYRDFASSLIDVILDPYRATATRQSGACYLASFVSRCSFVCVETVCESVDALLRWAEAYIQSLGPMAVHAPDAREQCSMHSLFYTVCQSAFYIMCFRGSAVIQYLHNSKEENLSGLPFVINLGETRWTNICAHSLLPLRYCLESVRSEFIRIAKLFSLVPADVLERLLADKIDGGGSTRKKRVASRIHTAVTIEKERQNGGVGGLGQGTNPLDSFFPFDPYLLRRSHRFIEPFYMHWDGGAIDTVNTKDENDDDDDDNAHEEDEALNVVDGSDDDENPQDPGIGGSDSDSSQSDSDDDDDSDSDAEPTSRRDRFMSFASTATSATSRPGSLEDKSLSVNALNKREEMKQAWSQTLKRARAPSIENGSW